MKSFFGLADFALSSWLCQGDPCRSR